MSKELEEPAIEGVIVDGPIPVHYWGIDPVSDGRMASAHFTIEGDRVYMNVPPQGGYYEDA